MYHDPEWVAWAVGWLSGRDRSAASARRQGQRLEALLGGTVPEINVLVKLIRAGVSHEEMAARFRPHDEPADELGEVAVLRLQAAHAASDAAETLADPAWQAEVRKHMIGFLTVTVVRCAMLVREAEGATRAEISAFLKPLWPALSWP